MTCWKNSCVDFYNKDFQNKQIKEWHYAEKRYAIEGNYLQVKVFVLKRDINIENTSTETIKNWILRLKRIKAKAEKYVIDNIRAYF